jgi:peptidoglycan/xylan/chitin deacetylase (PgdA/CDA1 family)
VLSFTFDDFPASAAIHGAPVLESFGYRGTFYTCLAQLGAPSVSGDLAVLETILSLQRKGHEIGCHTATHRDCHATSWSVFEASIAENAVLARGAELPTFRSFAYPYGHARLSRRRAVSELFETVRSIRPGINRGRFDAAFLLGSPLMLRNGIEGVFDQLDALTRSDGWLILFSHDVGPSPSKWGVRPDELASVCRAAAAAGLEVLPVGEVLRR